MYRTATGRKWQLFGGERTAIQEIPGEIVWVYEAALTTA